MKLRPRLAMTADLIPPGVAVADIGSDHAFLPVYLVQAGVCPRAIAADIGEGPLRNAAETVARAGLQDKIELRLSDGFSRFAMDDAGVWVMAGMGGTLMARLLDAAQWLCQPGVTIVAQPMRHAHDLRGWLVTHGFRIEREAACRDAGRVYIALRAAYEGKNCIYSPGYAYYGEIIQNGDACAREYLSRELRLLRVRMEALRRSGQHPGELKQLEEIDDDFCSRYL